MHLLMRLLDGLERILDGGVGQIIITDAGHPLAQKAGIGVQTSGKLRSVLDTIRKLLPPLIMFRKGRLGVGLIVPVACHNPVIASYLH